MSGSKIVTVALTKDDWGVHFQLLVTGGGAGNPFNEYAIYRPVPSVKYHEPQRVFNKLRSVEDTMFVGTSMATLFNVQFVGSGYALVHTKDTRFGKTGRRELWAWHGTVPGSGFSRDAWEPYSEAMEYWKSPVTDEDTVLTQEMMQKTYDAMVARASGIPVFSRGPSPVRDETNDEYNAYRAEVSDGKMWKATNRFIRELQK